MIRLPEAPQQQVILKEEFVPEVRWYTPPRRKPPNTRLTAKGPRVKDY